MFEASMIRPNPVIAVLSMGLTPISPRIVDPAVVEIPVFARITKLPADPRFTTAGPAGTVVAVNVLLTTAVLVRVSVGTDVLVGVSVGVSVAIGVFVGGTIVGVYE